MASNALSTVSGAIEGGWDLVWKQIVGILAALAWSLVLSSAILWVISQFMSLRVGAEEELLGLDRASHNEPAYSFDEIGFGWAATQDSHGEPVTGIDALMGAVRRVRGVRS